MSSVREKSLTELRWESEQNRAQLAATVTELRGRMSETAGELKTLVSPTHIKQEIRNYVQHERESFTGFLGRRVQENPLQAVAVGAAVAYPALGILRAVPMPLWLITAGLLLTSDRGRKAASQAASVAKSRIEDAVESGTETLSQTATTVQSAVRSQIGERIDQLRTTVSEAGESVSAGANSLTAQARAAFHDASDAVNDAISQTKDSATDAGRNLADGASETLNAANSQATQAVTRSRSAVDNLVQDYPLLLAGFGAALGMVLAASVPASQAENRMLGAGSRRLKRTAQRVAAQGLETASDMASSAIAGTAAAAIREGINADGIRNAVGKVAEGVTTVVERGLDTAIGQSEQAASPNSRSGQGTKNE